MDISRRLYHENIVQLLDYFETSTEFCLISELATGQLFEVIEEDKRLPESEIRKICQQLTSALYYLHENNIIHRDIKPQNILISSSGVIKLCDFGFARLIDNKTMIESVKGTPLYMAPELIRDHPYNKKADLWSLGVILFELFVGQPPFYATSFPTLVKKVNHDEVRYPETMSAEFKDFLKGLLIKNPKDRWNWPRILNHPFLKETEKEKQLKMEIQDNYRKWIIRLKGEKIFNLYESESYLAKFANDTGDVENNQIAFASFDSDRPQSTKRITSANSNATLPSDATAHKNDFWAIMEAKANTEEGATSLRQDAAFAEKVVQSLKSISKDDKITDKKFACVITKILFSVLTKGKFDNHHIDITKNQSVLTTSIAIFRISQQDESQSILLNDIIKVIGLIIKFFCYYSSGIDLGICNGFLRYVPNVLTSQRSPNLYINMLKAVGLMITAANIVPKRSLLFYNSIIDFGIINILFRVIKNYKNQQFALTKACIDCIVLLIFPINGEIHPFPILRNETMENKFDDYNDVKTAFSHIELLKKHLLQLCADEHMFDVLSIIYDLENDTPLKISILKILLQLLRFSPGDMIHCFTNTSSPYVKIVNSAVTCEETDKKYLIQLGILILIELIKYSNSNNVKILDYGYEIPKVLNYLQRTFQIDNTILCLTFGLLSECMSLSNTFIMFNPKYVKMIKEIIRNAKGKGRDDNKKLEGTGLGYLHTAILDYPIMYLEKIIKLLLHRDKYKNEILNTISENQFEDVFIEIISNSYYKNEFSPKAVNAALSIIYELLSCEYKPMMKKAFREHSMKSLIIFIKRRQFLAIKDWPGYKNNSGLAYAHSIFITALKVIKYAVDGSYVTEEIARGDFFYNLRNAFEYINKEHYRIVVSILNVLVNLKREEKMWNVFMEYFSKAQNLSFIQTYGLLKDNNSYNKDVIGDILSFLSALCRKSNEVYKAIDSLNIFDDLKNLIENSNESTYKSRVCNLLGNMCRHSDFFYDQIKQSGIIVPLLKCCYDNDKATRKFACFAIGNAAFLNEKLYESFRPIIPKMVELLKDPEDNTRANSAGALGNFVRCGDKLCQDIINAKAHEALLKLAETEKNPQIQIIRVALFALGNFCNHSIIKNELDKINFRSRIDSLKDKFREDNLLLDHIERIKKKLKGS